MDDTSPYRPGFEGWEVFDELPPEIRRAHQIVWTGQPIYSNQYRERTNMEPISAEDAEAIIALDGGRNSLSAREICGDIVFSSRFRAS